MADVTYDIAWVTNFRYDSLTAGASGIIPRLRALLGPIAQKWGGIIQGVPRVGDYVHLKLRIDDASPLNAVIDDLKGQMSFILQNEYPDDLKQYHHGRYMWKRRDVFVADDSPDDSVIDAWVAKRPKHSLPG
jgi:REP element-mobilizing transposase RayT